LCCDAPLPCRLFLSAEPPPALERGLPINLLQNSIKLTNEPPEGMRPNLIRAFNSFNEEMLESCAKQVRVSLLGMCSCAVRSSAPAGCLVLLAIWTGQLFVGQLL
jgi:hypothetical protein